MQDEVHTHLHPHAHAQAYAHRVPYHNHLLREESCLRTMEIIPQQPNFREERHLRYKIETCIIVRSYMANISDFTLIM